MKFSAFLLAAVCSTALAVPVGEEASALDGQQPKRDNALSHTDTEKRNNGNNDLLNVSIGDLLANVNLGDILRIHIGSNSHNKDKRDSGNNDLLNINIGDLLANINLGDILKIHIGGNSHNKIKRDEPLLDLGALLRIHVGKKYE